MQHWPCSHIDTHLSSLQAEAVTYAGQHQAMRQRTYSVLSDIKTGHRFAPMVVPPAETHDGHPGIAWEAFHKVHVSQSCVSHATSRGKLGCIWLSHTMDTLVAREATLEISWYHFLPCEVCHA